MHISCTQLGGECAIPVAHDSQLSPAPCPSVVLLCILPRPVSFSCVAPTSGPSRPAWQTRTAWRLEDGTLGLGLGYNEMRCSLGDVRGRGSGCGWVRSSPGCWLVGYRPSRTCCTSSCTVACLRTLSHLYLCPPTLPHIVLITGPSYSILATSSPQQTAVFLPILRTRKALPD